MQDFPNKVTNDSYTAAEFNQMAVELENAIKDTGQTLAGADLFQVSKSMSNYVAAGSFYNDTGAADAYVLNPLGQFRAPTEYFNGMVVRFKPGNTNTGASTVNVNSLGVKSIKIQDGVTDPDAGDVMTGIDIILAYDGTNFRIINRVTASKATMEAATDNVQVTTPLRVNDHPGVPKAWVNFNGQGAISIRSSHNVSSLTDIGVGNWQVNLTVPFSTAADYAIVTTAGAGSGQGVNNVHSYGNQTANDFEIFSEDFNTGPQDITSISAIAIGAQ